jgi:hypothetical protein
VYLVLNDLGQLGQAFLETDIAEADHGAIIRNFPVLPRLWDRPRLRSLDPTHFSAPVRRTITQGGTIDPRQKSLNRFGASAAYTTVPVIDRCPSHPWIARVLWPLLASA